MPKKPEAQGEILDPGYLESWLIHLRGSRKSDQTVKSYRDGVRQFLSWCAATDTTPRLDRPTVRSFIADLLESGREPATAHSRQMSLCRLSHWLFDEGEIDEDLLRRLPAVKVDTKVVRQLSEEECKALIEACDGKGFRDRRDEAIVRILLETGMRRGELIGMTVDDIDLQEGICIIRRGKGGKGRVVSIGPRTCKAVDRYLRQRRRHRLADTAALWLGDRGRTLGYNGFYFTLQYRAKLAGIEDFWPHMLRNTAAARWLDRGGSEGGLMAMAGWSRREMLDRYTQAASERRAIAEARRLDLGDF
ncbi:tyrosine-type recombinase/integrase [Streptomyces harbinensis]|uniref:tyrosine-type recombinase/integrase n=1 Tax=Streptomyces harbinensis TaxID=1176198 RepID=UPI00371A990E